MWDWITTQRELKRAMEIDPASIDSTNGWYLATMGRMDEALKQMNTAQRLAPLDLQINIDLAYLHHYEGRYDKAIDQARKTLEIDPNYWFAHQVLGLIYERKKQFPEAIAALKKARPTSEPPTPECRV